MSMAILGGVIGNNICSNACIIENTEVIQSDKYELTGSVDEDMTVEEMKEYLLCNEYTCEELDFEYVSLKVEQLNECYSDEDKVLRKMDEIVVAYFQNYDELATCGGKVEVAYEMWCRLTNEEKKLCIRYPGKALAVNAASDKAYELTNENYGYNGLGDESDGFRHAVWNALMTRDIGKKYAEKFATAHESGLSKKQLKEKEKDGYTKEKHRKMDLHNNKIGRNLIKGKMKNSAIVKSVKKKLTNKKKTGIYWLHD